MSQSTPIANHSSMVDDDCNENDCTNFIIMSDAGKPIFVRYETTDITRICGLLQAIRTSTQSSQHTSSLGQIQSLRSTNTCIVFMVVGSIILIAIDQSTTTNTEAYLRLRLEYIYNQIILTVTEVIQQNFQWNPSFDLNTILDSTCFSFLHNILNDTSTSSSSFKYKSNNSHSYNPGLYLLGGVESIFPLSSNLRAHASRTLQVVGLQTPFTIFALLVVQGKILSIVQPIYLPHQLRTSDLQLLLKFVNRQPTLYTNENWIPICLPRFAANDFLFCYTHCFDISSKLCLLLISQQGTTEQFDLFRQAAIKIRRSLGLSTKTTTSTNETILEIIQEPSCDDETNNAARTDVKWRRRNSGNNDDEDVDSENDYVDASGNGDKMIGCADDDIPLLKEIRIASDLDNQQRIFQDYLKIGSMLHFLFRFDAPIRSYTPAITGGHATGRFTQCLCPPLMGSYFKNDSSSSCQRLWSMYQKLNLRLRLGSASIESTMDAFDMISLNQESTQNEDFSSPGIGKHCPAMCLAASPANIDGVTYVLDSNELFFAMNGRNFEL